MTISLTTVAQPPLEPIPSLPPGLEQGATEIVDLLQAAAVPLGDGVMWNGPELQGQTLPLTPDLLSGTAGIAAFLATWAHVERCQVTRATALAAVLPLRRQLEDFIDEAAAAPDIDIDIDLGGGYQGIGSMIYTLSRIALLLDDPACAHAAVQAANRITPEQIAAQRRAGLVDGVAGLTLALIVAQKAALAFTVPADFSAPILACGNVLRSLLDNAKSSIGSGFGHGYSGIAYALTRLYDEHPAGDWHWDAHVALAQERRLFDVQLGVWLNPEGTEPVMANAWSHGAAGMLLARTALASRRIEALDPASHQDFQRCLHGTREQAARRLDHLNGGNLGHALILQQAGRDLEDADLSALALQIGRSVASRCPDTLFLPETQRRLTPWTDLSLMNGLAGIGYAFLKLHRPNLPSFLLLE